MIVVFLCGAAKRGRGKRAFWFKNLPLTDGEERLRRGEECPLGIVKKSLRSREERTCGA